mgnify:CR=1 FL=1
MVRMLMTINIDNGSASREKMATSCQPQINVTGEATQCELADVASTTTLSTGGLRCLN